MSILLTGVGNKGAALLSAGKYHADGDVSLAPVAGNYTVTTTFDDVIQDDQTTGVTAAGLVQTEVIVLGSAIEIATWRQTKTYQGNVIGSPAFSYWNGSAWVSMTDTNGVAWAFHPGFSAETRVAAFTGTEGSWAIYRCVTTIGAGALQTTDSRPLA